MAKEKLNSSFFGNFETSGPDSDDLDEQEVSTEYDTDEDDEPTDEELENREEEQEVEEEESEEELGNEPDPFIDTINHLAEKGLITYDEDHEYEEEGEELLEKVFSETLEKRFQEEFVDSIPEEYQSIFKHLQSGRPLDEWVEAVKPTDFDSIDLDNEDNQKQLIEDHLALTGMDEEDIKERIQELEDSGVLEKNAKTAVKYLKKAEEGKTKAYEQELEEQMEYQKQVQAKQFEDFERTVLTTEKLKDYELPKTKREKLLAHITKPVNKNGESQFVINQKSMENQLLLAYMDMEGYTLKDIMNKAETKATSNLRKSLSRITDTNAKGLNGSTGRTPTEKRTIPKGPWG